MLCGRCEKPILCQCCGETEYSQEVRDGHKFIPDDCECEKVVRYIDKDTMWNIKSTIEAIQIFVFIVCLIGFIVAFLVMWFSQARWVSDLIGWSMAIGLINFLFLISCDYDWRENYIDHSTVMYIREERPR